MIGYLPTFLKDDKYEPKTGVCTLILRRFSVKRKRNGLTSVEVKTDALDFSNEDAMVEWIEENEAFELPPEAESDPRFIPRELVAVGGDPE